MAEAQQHKASEHTHRKKLELPPLSLHTVKQMGSSAPTTPVSQRKPTSVRANCLCSPTTHAGSFRCRYHRNSTTSTSGLTRNFLSVGAKLSDLAGKQTEICNTLHAQ